MREIALANILGSWFSKSETEIGDKETVRNQDEIYFEGDYLSKGQRFVSRKFEIDGLGLVELTPEGKFIVNSNQLDLLLQSPDIGGGEFALQSKVIEEGSRILVWSERKKAV